MDVRELYSLAQNLFVKILQLHIFFSIELHFERIHKPQQGVELRFVCNKK